MSSYRCSVGKRTKYFIENFNKAKPASLDAAILHQEHSWPSKANIDQSTECVGEQGVGEKAVQNSCFWQLRIHLNYHESPQVWTKLNFISFAQLRTVEPLNADTFGTRLKCPD